MFNPFVRFEPHFTARIMRDNKRFLVTQTYERGYDPLNHDNTTHLLVTDYDDLDYAKIHLGALHDKYKSIIDLQNPKHRAKFEEMLLAGSAYTVWWSFVINTEKTSERLNKRFKDHIRRYIIKNMNWRITNGESVIPRLECIFGELFIHLKRGGQREKVRFEDIEKS